MTMVAVVTMVAAMVAAVVRLTMAVCMCTMRRPPFLARGSRR